MRPINSQDRRVINLKDAVFTSFDSEKTGEKGTSFLNLNPDTEQGIGFYIDRMAPQSHSAPHRHSGAEEFYVIEGDLRDHDGAVYKAGDVVWSGPGTVHNSYSKNGCTVAVFSEVEN